VRRPVRWSALRRVAIVPALLVAVAACGERTAQGTGGTLGRPGAGHLVKPPRADAHDEYVFTDAGYYVYRAERAFALVERVHVPGIRVLRDVVADGRRGFFYISYATNHIKKWDFVHRRQVWDRTYAPATDAAALAPGGATLYMATGSFNAADWLVIRTADGHVARTLHADGDGSHNTDVSADGRHVFLGIHNTPRLAVYDTHTSKLTYVEGLTNGVRPIAVDGGNGYAYLAQTGLFGFSVGDVRSGRTLYTVTIHGFRSSSPGYVKSGADIPSHGIAISPDEREVWVIDKVNGMVHVFDVTGLPRTPPKQVADITLADMNDSESECSVACAKEGWVQFSRDGRHVFVGDTGAVVDARTRKVAARLPALAISRKHIEVDWYRGKPVWGSPTRSSQGFVRPARPASGYAERPASEIELGGAIDRCCD
jgi:DNA-binding beta-propeller fold protein YncE